MDYRVISADDHIDMLWLPKDTWQKRVPAAWRDRAPKVIDGADGPEWVWASDYPHADSTWPAPQRAIEENFKDVAPTARRRITCLNAKALYGF